ncbi:MAG TPA: sigma-70 family RNA polymerase sigma factor [Streptosporangiaceae bacterium]|nr:sigma-70 family RNA polymerase sigma factor [Streptosporangiaceae bacterium]
MEWARLIAGLAHYSGDVGLAEELAQDAVVAALEQWPEDGVPRNPGAWLMTVAKRRAIDLFRRNRELERKYAQIGRDLDTAGAGGTSDFDQVVSDDIDDDLLRLIFTACHPVLAVPARVALTLRLLGGLTTAEIARAYLVPEPTIAQRIVRAKKTLAKAHVKFETPDSQQRPARMSSVLEVIYLIFNEGYSATAGEDWMRPALCHEALRLGRVLAQLAPAEPEVHGLQALMEIQASRIPARTGPAGEPVLLLDQDRARWDRLLINRGLAALSRAEELGGARGPYALQAAIAACHARAFRPEDTDWARITELYAILAKAMPSPVVELNRAVAVSMAFGPQAGLDLVDQLAAEPALRSYHLLSSVRGDLLMKLGRAAEARAEFERASELTRNGPERQLTAMRARCAEANVHIDISGWSPKRIPPEVIRELRGRLNGQFLWGSDYPFLAPERCLSELSDLGLPADALQTVLHDNAARILGLNR